MDGAQAEDGQEWAPPDRRSVWERLAATGVAPAAAAGPVAVDEQPVAERAWHARRLREEELVHGRQQSRAAVSEQLAGLVAAFHRSLQAEFVRAEQAEQRAERLEVCKATAAELEQQLLQAKRRGRPAGGAEQTAVERGGSRPEREALARLERRLQQAEQRLGSAAAAAAAECSDGSIGECQRRREEAELDYKAGLSAAEQLEETVAQWEESVGRVRSLECNPCGAKLRQRDRATVAC